MWGRQGWRAGRTGQDSDRAWWLCGMVGTGMGRHGLRQAWWGMAGNYEHFSPKWEWMDKTGR